MATLALLASSVLVFAIPYCSVVHCDKLFILTAVSPHEQGVNFPLFLPIPSSHHPCHPYTHTRHLDKMQREKDSYGDLNLITM